MGSPTLLREQCPGKGILPEEVPLFDIRQQRSLNRPGFPRHFPSSGNIASQTPLAIAA